MGLGSAVLTLGAKTKGFVMALGKAKDALGTLVGVLQKYSFGLFGPIVAGFKTLAVSVAAISAPFIYGIFVASKFEKQMAEIKTMLFGQTEAFGAMTSGVRNLSLQYGESTETLARGLYDILSAGIPASKALDVLEVSAKAATAGLTSTGVTADAVTSILNSFQLSAENAGAVAELLSRIVLKGKTTWAELAPQIGKTSANAFEAGVSMEEVGAAIGTLTKAGIKTPRAITAINRALMALMAPSKRQIEIFKQMGFEADEFGVKFKDMGELIQKIAEGVGTESEATTTMLREIFQIRGTLAINALKGAGEEFTHQLKFMRGETEETGSVLDHQFKSMADTFDFEWRKMKTAFTDLLVEVFTPMLPHLRRLVSFVREIFDNIKTNTPGVDNFFKRAIDFIMRFISGFIKIGGAIAKIGAYVVAYAMLILETAGKVLKKDGIQGMIMYLLKWTLNAVRAFLTAVAIVLINFIKDFVPWVLKFLWNVVTGDFQEAVETTGDFVIGLANGVMKEVRNAFIFDMFGAKKDHEDYWGDILDAEDSAKEVGKFVDQVTGGIGDIEKKWKDFQGKRDKQTEEGFKKIKYGDQLQAKKDRRQLERKERNFKAEMAMIEKSADAEKKKIKDMIALYDEWLTHLRKVNQTRGVQDMTDEQIRLTKKQAKLEKRLTEIIKKEQKKRADAAKKAAKEAWRAYKKAVDTEYGERLEAVDLVKATEEEKLDIQIGILKEWLSKYEKGTREWLKVYKKLVDTVDKFNEKVKQNIDELVEETSTALQDARSKYVEWAEKTLRMGERGAKAQKVILDRYRRATKQIFEEEMRMGSRLAKGGFYGDRWKNAVDGLAKLKAAAEDERFTEKQRAKAAEQAAKAQAYIEEKAKKAFGDKWKEELKARGLKYGMYKEEISAEEQAIAAQKEFGEVAQQNFNKLTKKSKEFSAEFSKGMSEAAVQVGTTVTSILDGISKKVDEIISKVKSIGSAFQGAGPGSAVNDFFGKWATAEMSQNKMLASIDSTTVDILQRVNIIGRRQVNYQKQLLECCCRTGGIGRGDTQVNVGPISIGQVDDSVDMQIAGEKMGDQLLNEVTKQVSL